MRVVRYCSTMLLLHRQYHATATRAVRYCGETYRPGAALSWKYARLDMTSVSTMCGWEGVPSRSCSPRGGVCAQHHMPHIHARVVTTIR